VEHYAVEIVLAASFRSHREQCGLNQGSDVLWNVGSVRIGDYFLYGGNQVGILVASRELVGALPRDVTIYEAAIGGVSDDMILGIGGTEFD